MILTVKLYSPNIFLVCFWFAVIWIHAILILLSNSLRSCAQFWCVENVRKNCRLNRTLCTVIRVRKFISILPTINDLGEFDCLTTYHTYRGRLTKIDKNWIFLKTVVPTTRLFFWGSNFLENCPSQTQGKAVLSFILNENHFFQKTTAINNETNNELAQNSRLSCFHLFLALCSQSLHTHSSKLTTHFFKNFE